MAKIMQKIMYFILSIQEKMLAKKLSSNLKSTYSSSTSKMAFKKGCTLNLTAQTEQNKVKLENSIIAILKEHNNNPESLLEYISSKGTHVVRHKSAKKVLGWIKEEEGLLTPLKGMKALIFNLALMNKFSFKTEQMFIFNTGEIDKYQMIHQFHKWYAMKLQLPGFENNAQENLKKYIDAPNSAEINSLNLEEILSLKEAITRDVEAINFVTSLAKQTDGSKNALNKIVSGGATV